jgi:serine protease
MLLLLLTAITPFSAFAASTSTSSKSISQVTTEVTNPYDPAYQHNYRHGAVPTIEQLANIKAYQRTHATARVADAISSKTMVYHGGIDGIGVTSGKEKVYLVFWGTQWGKKTIKNGHLTFSKDTAGAAPRLQNLFKGLGTGGEQWSGTMTQYCDGPKVKKGATSCSSGAAHVAYPTGGALAGVWYDNSAAEPSAASGNQLAKEAIKAAGHFGNTTAASNRYAQYIIVSPPGTNPDNYKGNFCAWHDYNGDSSLSGGAAPSHYGDIAFTNLPYLLEEGTSCGENFVNSGTAGKLDGFTITAGHEYAETVTDQNAGGGWINASNTAENGDECAWITPGKPGGSNNVKMGNGSYAMQSTWSNDTNECDLAHATIN